LALTHANGEVAKVLLKNTAEVNTKDEKGITPLHLAAKIGDKALVEVSF